MGTQLMMGDKVRAANLKDGADVRKLAKIIHFQFTRFQDDGFLWDSPTSKDDETE